MIVCKYDCFSKLLPTLHLQSFIHKVLKDIVYRIYIKYVVKYLIATNIPVSIIIRIQYFFALPRFFVLPHRFQLLLFVITEVVVHYALLHYKCSAFQSVVWHKVFILDGFVKFVCKCILSIYFEQIECIPIHFVARGCGKPDKQTVEIVYDRDSRLIPSL